MAGCVASACKYIYIYIYISVPVVSFKGIPRFIPTGRGHAQVRDENMSPSSELEPTCHPKLKGNHVAMGHFQDFEHHFQTPLKVPEYTPIPNTIHIYIYACTGQKARFFFGGGVLAYICMSV